VPKFDAAAVARARAAGAIVIGKAATHEFGWGITTNNPHFGPTRNPWDPERIPGGSSGGTGAALATGMAPLAIGSDTGGSIRIPAAFCGVVGCKPTWGRVSTAGAMPLARSLDHAGPMARTPADAALLYAVIAGVDRHDPATEAVQVEEPAWEGVAGITVGVPEAAPSAPLGPSAVVAVQRSAELLESLGAHVSAVLLPDAERVLATFVTIQRAEALHSHRESGRYPARAAEYGHDVRGRLEAAAHVTLADYLEALAERQRIRADVAQVLRQVDVLLSPVSAISPPPIGSDLDQWVAGAPGR
jgi:aspartyl-tRNA(Asn)/glutamyl-tRNA(Gln) amidotransferase subunit A